MEPRDLKFEDIKIDDEASFTHIVSKKDTQDFIKLSGDKNPLHVDLNYARKNRFGKRIVHGMFLGALCSRLLGMYLPGKRCLYLSQYLQFRGPAFIGDKLLISGKVIAKSTATKILDIMIYIKCRDKILTEGLAKVQVL